MQADIISKATFIDPTADLSVVVLNGTQTRFRLLIGDGQDGRDAQIALFAISRAQDAIQTAESENRSETLNLAETLLANAHTLFTMGMFTQSDALAVSSETTANTATVPKDYARAAQLIAQAEALRNQTANLSTHQSTVLAQANTQLQISITAFEGKNFTYAIESAQAAVDLFNMAKQIDFTQTILIWLSNLALVVPVVILAYALVYQLKRD
jgi:hypothetical protein